MGETRFFTHNIFKLGAEGGSCREELLERLDQVSEPLALFNPGMSPELSEAYAAQVVFKGIAFDALTFTAAGVMSDAQRFIDALNPDILPEIRDEIASAYVSDIIAGRTNLGKERF